MTTETNEKPLHVRVAEALGMECVPRGGAPGMMSYVYIDARLQYLEGNCPRYDTDWSATGPLVERFGISTAMVTGPPESMMFGAPDSDRIALKELRWHAWVKASTASVAGDAPTEYHAWSRTPLIAACEVILSAASDGKLESVA